MKNGKLLCWHKYIEVSNHVFGGVVCGKCGKILSPMMAVAMLVLGRVKEEK